MEFSYRISEAEYLTALRLRREAAHGSRRARTVLFWIFIMVCLILLWAVVQKGATTGKNLAYAALYDKVQSGQVQDAVIRGDELTGHLKGSKEEFRTTLPANYNELLEAMIAARVDFSIKERQSNMRTSLLINVGPFALLLIVWFLLLRQLGPKALRRMYGRDPTMQGEFTVNVSAQSIAIRNTAGSSFTSGWNVYEYWREGKNLIVLALCSGAYTTLNISGLSDVQRNELRGILSGALPKR
jgi:hypothetical protein